MCEGRLGMMWKIISSCAGFQGPLPLMQPQFSLPRNLEVEYGYYISYLHVIEHICVIEISSQIASEAILRGIYINSKFSWGTCPRSP